MAVRIVQRSRHAVNFTLGDSVIMVAWDTAIVLLNTNRNW